MTEHDVQDLIAAVTIAQTEWVNGVVNPLWDLREGTIFGPFGGPAGGGPGLDEAQSRIAALFHDGSAELDIANTIVSGDVVCLALVERNSVRFDGDDEPRPWILRSTVVFRRDGDSWTLLHRHADPLIQTRDLTATLALLPTTM